MKYLTIGIIKTTQLMKETISKGDQITEKETGRAIAQCYGNAELASEMSELINESLGIKSAEEPVDETAEAKESETTMSTDMSADDAIKHIKNTPVEELTQFVPKAEDRVTVLEALEDKRKKAE